MCRRWALLWIVLLAGSACDDARAIATTDTGAVADCGPATTHSDAAQDGTPTVEVIAAQPDLPSYCQKVSASPEIVQVPLPEIPTPIDLVRIPSGCFWMGCNEATDDECLDDEKPGRYVQVKAYEIMKFEVTNEQYDLCTKLHPGKCSGFFPGKPAAKEPVPNTRCTKQPWLPVCAYQDSVKIMFEEFCETMIPGGRLPTEAEWEKAARGGCETTVGDCQTAARKYPWGQSPGPCLALQGCAYSHSCYVFQPWSCPGLAVLRVPGTDPGDVSPYGVYDMVSNASEQVGDVYFADWYQKAPPVDPRTPEPHAGSLMRRGGDGMYGPKRHRASFRQSPNNLIVYRLGFRCARDVPAGP